MSRVQLAKAMGQIRRMLGTVGGTDLDDRQLLEQFTAARDEAAFAALVQRYGPLVLGVCRRILGNEHDAEDAFQATFLVLARKSRSVGWRESIGNWLYNVAYHVATKAYRGAARRREHERRARTMSAQPTTSPVDWHELRPILDEELYRLPEKYRMPLLLCYLQGRSKNEAAEQLGWTAGEVKGRLQRGRELLRGRLARRGLAPALVLAVQGQGVIAAVPKTLVTTTVQAALAGTVTAPVLALTQGAVQAMFWCKVKTWTLYLAAAAVLGFGVGELLSRSGVFALAPAAEAARADPRVDPDRYDQADAVLRGIRFRGVAAGIMRFSVLETLKNKSSIPIGNQVKVSLSGMVITTVGAFPGLDTCDECTIYLQEKDDRSWVFLSESPQQGVSHASPSRPAGNP